jgi:hypothetical protein
MSLRQPLKPRADVLELFGFAQNRIERHEHTRFLAKRLRWENFRWTGLGQKT